MEKVTTKQLLDATVEIVRLADKCHRAGLIDDWQASIAIENDDNYDFEVRLNPYTQTEVRWQAKARTYPQLEEPEANVEDLAEMGNYLHGLIDGALQEIQAKLDILNA